MNRRSFLAAIAASAGAAAIGRPARADDVSAVLAEITKARAGLKTLVGTFVQERTIGLLATTVKSTGTLTMVRPDRLRWELDAPDAVTYWVGPEGFAFATPSGSASAGKAAAGRFGAVLGDGVRTGVNTSIEAGVKIGVARTTKPGTYVSKDML